MKHCHRLGLAQRSSGESNEIDAPRHMGSGPAHFMRPGSLHLMIEQVRYAAPGDVVNRDGGVRVRGQRIRERDSALRVCLAAGLGLDRDAASSAAPRWR